ncbi:hypothetical protein [Rhodococcoides kroppenstedtii]|uniref:hypothetical protein n=1 Tax=Rhodococcoides kroppenstedtii TaxID=293050 RepID=UPI003630E552
MAGIVSEWYGYPVGDHSTEAVLAASEKTCPFVVGPCTKQGGVCAVRPSGETIIVCPKRLYFAGHQFLREIAADAFDSFECECGPDGLPVLIEGGLVRGEAARTGRNRVGVYGQEWGGEIKLPEAMPGGARYSIDFVLVVVGAAGDLLAFVPVEVQTIDTTGSYKPSVAALEASRGVVKSSFHMNWENVNKRILPQLITKGLMLQGEALCKSGMYFVAPEPVFKRIMIRLGGESRLRRIPKQPGGITFVRYAYDEDRAQGAGTLELTRRFDITISTSDMSLAFISPQNLPPAGSYERLIHQRL